jgi:thioredoxin reductase (NADPH)
MNAQVVAVEGADRVDRVQLSSGSETRVVPADAVFPNLGVEPNSELVAGTVRLDQKGFVLTDSRQRTSLDWLYAAGDVCADSSWTIASAVGQSAAAVKDISRRLSANE